MGTAGELALGWQAAAGIASAVPTRNSLLRERRGRAPAAAAFRGRPGWAGCGGAAHWGCVLEEVAWNFLDRRAEEKQGTYRRGRWRYFPGIADKATYVLIGSVFPTLNEFDMFTEINSRKRKSKEEEKRLLSVI